MNKKYRSFCANDIDTTSIPQRHPLPQLPPRRRTIRPHDFIPGDDTINATFGKKLSYDLLICWINFKNKLVSAPGNPGTSTHFFFLSIKWLVVKLLYYVSFGPHCLAWSSLSCDASWESASGCVLFGSWSATLSCWFKKKQVSGPDFFQFFFVEDWWRYTYIAPTGFMSHVASSGSN